MNILKTLWERLFTFYQTSASKNTAGAIITNQMQSNFPYINTQDGALCYRCGTIDEKKMHKAIHRNLSAPSMAISVANLTNSSEGISNLSKLLEIL